MDLKSNVINNFKNVSHNKYLKIDGGKFLRGNIKISGAKNSALVLMAASILSESEINLFNVPQISDVAIMSKLLTTMGINIKSNKNQLTINTKEINIPPQDLFFDLCNALRAVSYTHLTLPTTG